MRLVDAITANNIPILEDSRRMKRGIPWINHLSNGNGECDIDEKVYEGSAYDGWGFGQGDARGGGNCLSIEYHLFGGDHMQLTLLQAWRYL